MKKYFGLIALWAGVILGFTVIANAAQNCVNTDFFCYESGPSQNLNTIGKMDSSGNLFLLGNIQQGITGTPLTSLNTSGNSIGHKVPILLSGANAAVEGSVIIASTTINSTVTGSVVTVTGSQSFIGIASGPIAVGAVGNIFDSGFVLALTTGTVVAGDILISSGTTTGGYLVTNNSATNVDQIAVAVTASPASANGLTRVKLIH